MKWKTYGPKDWPEDTHLENGNYYCKCVGCNSTFVGEKHRVICKECAKDFYTFRKAMISLMNQVTPLSYSASTREGMEEIFSIYQIPDWWMIELEVEESRGKITFILPYKFSIKSLHKLKSLIKDYGALNTEYVYRWKDRSSLNTKELEANQEYLLRCLRSFRNNYTYEVIDTMIENVQTGKAFKEGL